MPRVEALKAPLSPTSHVQQDSADQAFITIFQKGKTRWQRPCLPAEAVSDTQIFQVAQASESLKVRVRKIVSGLEQIYGGGRSSCIFGQFATASIGPSARESLKQSLKQWVTAITKLARDSGMTEVRAREFAEDWVARLQGALIVQAINGSTSAFERALKTLLDLAKDKRQERT